MYRVLIGLWLFIPLPVWADCVVLLHGVTRTDASMHAIERVLSGAGYQVINRSYPSTDARLEALVPHVDAAIAECDTTTPIHAVTHSMGGILLRAWQDAHPEAGLGRVVMLAPPNQGSELADRFRDWPGFEAALGPAGQQLGTDADGPRSFGLLNAQLGVIAGTRSVSAIGAPTIPGPDDGKVGVSATYLDGMADHRTVAVTHTFITVHPIVLAETLAFLRDGAFRHDLTYAQALREVWPYRSGD